MKNITVSFSWSNWPLCFPFLFLWLRPYRHTFISAECPSWTVLTPEWRPPWNLASLTCQDMVRNSGRRGSNFHQQNCFIFVVWYFLLAFLWLGMVIRVVYKILSSRAPSVVSVASCGFLKNHVCECVCVWERERERERERECLGNWWEEVVLWYCLKIFSSLKKNKIFSSLEGILTPTLAFPPSLCSFLKVLLPSC